MKYFALLRSDSSIIRGSEILDFVFENYVDAISPQLVEDVGSEPISIGVVHREPSAMHDRNLLALVHAEV